MRDGVRLEIECRLTTDGMSPRAAAELALALKQVLRFRCRSAQSASRSWTDLQLALEELARRLKV